MLAFLGNSLQMQALESFSLNPRSRSARLHKGKETKTHLSICPSKIIIFPSHSLAFGDFLQKWLFQLTTSALILPSPNPDCPLSALCTPACPVSHTPAPGSSLSAMTPPLLSLQNMKMVPVPEKAYGTFFEGDCYIILHVRQQTLVSVGQLVQPFLFRSALVPRYPVLCKKHC